jgi:Rhodanese-like domain.
MSLFTRVHAEPVQAITAVDLHEKLSSGNKPTLLDVREPVEFRSGHIAGAQMIPLGELKKNGYTKYPRRWRSSASEPAGTTACRQSACWPRLV